MISNININIDIDIDINFKYYLLSDNNKLYKSLAYNIKKDNKNNNYSCFLPKKIKENEYIYCLIDTRNNLVCSFIWFSIFSGNKIKIINKINKINEIKDDYQYIFINFSYTFEVYRNIGLNKQLRKFVEIFAYNNWCKYIISVSLPGSNSSIILDKLYYKKKDGYYIKKIF